MISQEFEPAIFRLVRYRENHIKTYCNINGYDRYRDEIHYKQNIICLDFQFLTAVNMKSYIFYPLQIRCHLSARCRLFFLYGYDGRSVKLTTRFQIVLRTIRRWSMHSLPLTTLWERNYCAFSSWFPPGLILLS